MRKDDRVLLQHMLDAANEALTFIQGKIRADLDNDRMLVLSLVRELEIIGEAASKVSAATRSQNTSIPRDRKRGQARTGWFLAEPYGRS
jgi:uncharacterized protein with HEPN domain